MVSRGIDKIKQRKSLSQVFLRETWPCRKLAAIIASHGIESVLEIGPGNGVLTRELLAKGLRVFAIEKDPRFADRLRDVFSSEKNFSIAESDFLKFDIDEWQNSHRSTKGICGNVPYNISAPLLIKIIQNLRQVNCAVLMFQLEFAERVTAAENSKNYGSLSVYAQLRSNISFDFKVERNCFNPIPKVDSGVITLVNRKNIENESILKKVEIITRQAFSQRRKKLKNSLENFIAEDEYIDPPLDFNRRCETLSPNDFVNLAKSLKYFAET